MRYYNLNTTAWQTDMATVDDASKAKTVSKMFAVFQDHQDKRTADIETWSSHSAACAVSTTKLGEASATPAPTLAYPHQHTDCEPIGAHSPSWPWFGPIVISTPCPGPFKCCSCTVDSNGVPNGAKQTLDYKMVWSKNNKITLPKGCVLTQAQ